MAAAAALRKPVTQASYFQVEHGRRDLDPGFFTKFPHEYLSLIRRDRQGRRRLMDGHVQRDLLYIIGLRTLGDPKRPEWARLSVREIARDCDVSVSTAQAALDDLVIRHIIAERSREGCGKTTVKMYRWTPENWEKAKPYQKPDTNKKLLALAEEIEAAWNQSGDDETGDGTPQAAAPRTHQATVEPKTPTPAAVTVKPRGGAPVRLEIVYHSDFSQPIAVSAEARRGQLHLTTGPAPAASPQADRNCTGGPVQLSAVSSPFIKNSSAADYRQYLPEVILNVWNTAKDENFIESVITAADGAPWQTFLDQLRIKFGPKFERAHRHQPGLLRNLAETAANAHRLKKAQAPAKQAAVAPQKPAEPLDPARPWDQVRAAIRARISPESYTNWFAYTRQLQSGPDMLVVSAPDRQTADFLAEEYMPLIQEILNQLNRPGAVEFRPEAA